MTCWQCGVDHPGERLVTLHDGRQAGEYSDEWRRECEARFVLDMPSKHARYAHLQGVRDKRGLQSAAHLAADIVAMLPEDQRFFAINGICAQFDKDTARSIRDLTGTKPPTIAGQGDLFSN